MCFRILALIMCVTALALTVFTGCKNTKEESEAEVTTAMTVESEPRTDAQEEAEPVEQQTPKTYEAAYNYHIGIVGNSNDPLFTKAIYSATVDDKQVYLHKFDSKAQANEFLMECADESNYYVQQIANSIYCYDDGFFEHVFFP